MPLQNQQQQWEKDGTRSTTTGIESFPFFPLSYSCRPRMWLSMDTYIHNHNTIPKHDKKTGIKLHKKTPWPELCNPYENDRSKRAPVPSPLKELASSKTLQRWLKQNSNTGCKTHNNGCFIGITPLIRANRQTPQKQANIETITLNFAPGSEVPCG